MFLDREQRYYATHRDEWLARGMRGQWVVLHDEQVTGFYPSLRLGFLAGFRRWTPDVFLVKQVASDDGATPLGTLLLPRLATGAGDVSPC